MKGLLKEFSDKAFSRPPELKARKAEGKKIVKHMPKSYSKKASVLTETYKKPSDPDSGTMLDENNIL